MPGRWHRFPRATRLAIRDLFDANPLRRQLPTWRALCGDCADFEFVQCVLTHGLVVLAPADYPAPFAMRNHGSCADDVVVAKFDKLFAKELATSVIALPDEFVQSLGLFVHPLGAIAKSDGGVRAIHDFSCPADDCLNDHILYAPTKLAKHDEMFGVLRKHMYMAKLDLKAFFRHIPIDPHDWRLLAFCWKGTTYVDTRVNFGMRNAPEVAQRFSQIVLEYLRTQIGAEDEIYVFVICDDWLVCSPDKAACLRFWLFVQDTLRALGFTLNDLKGVGPCWLLVWCGLEYDTELLTARLPADKVAKAFALIEVCLAAVTVTRAQVDSLFGYLSYCSAVVFGGRAFLHGIRTLRYRQDGSLLLASHVLTVSPGFRLDLTWWRDNLLRFNGDVRVPIVAMNAPHQHRDIWIDARGGDGGVGVFVDGGFVGLTGGQCNVLFDGHDGRLLSPGNWSPASTEANHWEMFAFCVLLDLFGESLRDTFVRVISDNMTAVRCVRDLSAALDSPPLATLTRVFLGLTVEYNVRIEPWHRPGVENVLADPLSRDAYPRFFAELSAWLETRDVQSPWVQSLL